MTTIALRTPAAVIAAVLIALAVGGCGASQLNPDPAACKAALQARYLKQAAGQRPSPAEPAVCRSLPRAEVQRFAQQVQAGR